MTVNRIYFDMDGVLADFDRGVRDLCGMETLPQSTRSPEQDDLMWDRIRKVDHFYDRLEPMAGAKEMFGAVYGAYPTGRLAAPLGEGTSVGGGSEVY